jgi:predicted transposase YdaD
MTKTADIGSKRLIGTNPVEWAQWATDIPDLQCLGIESSSFEWVSRQTDVLLRVRSPQYGEFLIVNEIQTRYSSEMPRRMRAYAALAEEKYSLPVYPVLVNLFPPSSDREIPNRYQSEFCGLRALQEYRRINLWEVDVQRILDRPIRPLIPFVPLFKNGNNELVVREALGMLRADETLEDFETLLAFFATFVLDTQLVQNIMRWDMAILEQSPLYRELAQRERQQGLQQGLQQGQQEQKRETIKNICRIRFGFWDEELESILDRILTLPAEESTRLLLELSKAELLAQFTDDSYSETPEE